MKTIRNLFLILLAGVLISACTSPAPEEPAAAPSPSPLAEATSTTSTAETAATPEQTSPTTAPEDAYPYPAPTLDSAGPAYPAPGGDISGYPEPGGPAEGCEVLMPEPQSLEFLTSDGLTLAGTFYPSADCDAPVVLLMHQFGSSKESWIEMAQWLQNRGAAGSTGLFPPMPDDLSLAVFTFDFRSHGESDPGEDDGIDTEGFLIDAQSALEFIKTLPGVNPDRIITMGASIGADASLDACLVLEGDDISGFQENKGCIGAFAFSPGSFLDVPYVEAANRLSQPPFDLVIACAAAELDGNTADLCDSAVPGRYTSTIYTGRSEHGIALLQPGLDPDIGQVVFNFILQTIGSP